MKSSSYYLTFKIHKWYFAIPVTRISAILEKPDFLKKESELDFMKGIQITENGVIPIIDSAKVLGLNDCGSHGTQQVLLCTFSVSRHLFKMGWKVHELSSVIEIDSEMVECASMDPALPFGCMTNGSIYYEGRVIYIIDLEKVFTEDGLLDVYNDMRKSLGMKVG